MKRLRHLTICFALTCMPMLIAIAQTNSGFSAGLGGQYVLPMADFGGTTSDFFSGTSYGLKYGLGGHSKMRFSAVGLCWTGELGYSYLWGNGVATSSAGSIDILGRFFMLRFGPEYQFAVGTIPATWYVGGNAAINNLGFDLRLRNLPLVTVSSADYITNSASRFGVGINAGALIRLTESVTLDVGVSYNFVNPFHQAWEDRDVSTDRRDDSYLALNDAPDPTYSPGSLIHFIHSSRKIHSLEINASILFN